MPSYQNYPLEKLYIEKKCVMLMYIGNTTLKSKRRRFFSPINALSDICKEIGIGSVHILFSIYGIPEIASILGLLSL